VSHQDWSGPGRGLRASLDKHASADNHFVVFNVGENKKLLERLWKQIQSSGRDVHPITSDQTGSSARELSKVDLVVVREAEGIKLITTIEVNGQPYKKNFPGHGDTVADASSKALELAVPYVFDKIDKVLRNRPEPATTDAVNSGGGDSLQGMEFQRSHLVDPGDTLRPEAVAARRSEEGD
jgi:hypothetical protein